MANDDQSPADKKVDERPFFDEKLEAFKHVLGRAQKISYTMHGTRTDTMGSWASGILFRICVQGDSIKNILRYNDYLDHFSIAVVVRSIIEAALMLFYVSETGLSEEQRKLRRDVLFLSDCHTRLRMFKALGDNDEAEKGRTIADELKERISSNPEFAKLQKDERTKIMRGLSAYVGGVRGVIRTAGLSTEWYDSIYVPLSSFTHSTTYSFMDMTERKIATGRSDYAHYSAGMSLFYVEEIISLVVQRMENFVLPLPPD